MGAAAGVDVAESAQRGEVVDVASPPAGGTGRHGQPTWFDPQICLDIRIHDQKQRQRGLKTLARSGQQSDDQRVRSSARLAIVKSLHTAIWLTVESALLYVLYSGLRGRTDRATKIAAGMVAAEVAVFLGNGARCPLTGVAESLGAESGSVSDIYLPDWLARNLPLIHVPLVLLAIYLHRNSLTATAKT